MKNFFPNIHFLKPSRNLFFTFSLFLIINFQFCTTQKVSRELAQVENAKQINPNSKYLKVHMTNGELYVLNKWEVFEANRIIKGSGNHLDINRKPVTKNRGEFQSAKPTAYTASSNFSIPYEEILLIETNYLGKNPGVATLIITSAITVPLAIVCISNPKSCFGSCPTFYTQDSENEKLLAEGFSSSISQSMEETDVDLLDFPFAQGPVEITMKNEALETHLVKSISLIACEREPGNSVIQGSDETFYEVGNLTSPLKATHNSLSIIDKLSSNDDLEWFSLADSSNLATKEEIFLEFDTPQEFNALIIEKRQSLMTTYLFYQMLAFTGMSTSYLISEMETKKPNYKNRINRMYELLGGIEVFVMDEKGKWVDAGTVKEAGPIASDMHLLKLPYSSTDKLKVKLKLTKGLWRMDMINLAQIKGEREPKRYYPEKIYAGGNLDSAALNKLMDSKQYLVTYPGDEYRMTFPVEAVASQQYFLESQGYYIEWVRDEWLKEENLSYAKKAMIFPSSYLKKTAPFFKQQEAEMETIFWNSKYSKVGIQ